MMSAFQIDTRAAGELLPGAGAASQEISPSQIQLTMKSKKATGVISQSTDMVAVAQKHQPPFAAHLPSPGKHA